MKSNLRNEIKSYIVRQGMTMQEVVDLLRDEHGWSDSVSNLSIASCACRSAICRACTITVASGSSLLFFLHNQIIGLLHLFETFFRLIFVRIVDICIRMILPAQCTVCFLYLFIRSATADAEHLIWICHDFFLFFFN